MAHHHIAIAVLFIVAGHMYRTNFGIGHRMRAILDKISCPFWKKFQLKKNLFKKGEHQYD